MVAWVYYVSVYMLMCVYNYRFTCAGLSPVHLFEIGSLTGAGLTDSARLGGQ